ncbi:MAG: GNAT family N-acetyltransferase [Acutalibacteraceae bacterium]
MLKLAKSSDIPKIEKFSEKHPLAVRISSQIGAYGLERDFLKVWFSEEDDNIISVLSCFDYSFTVCAEENADFCEISAFVNSFGYTEICAEKSIFEKCGFPMSKSKTMFVFKGNGKQYPQVKTTENLRSAYDLISEAIPGSFEKSENAYLHFLSDFTFRQRRSYARIKAIESETQVVSCALTAAESKTAALISGVACDKSQRGKGLGKQTVLTLVAELQSENKKVYVIALNESAEAFYEKLGFEKCLTVCYM